jgi:hypothetical protein
VPGPANVSNRCGQSDLAADTAPVVEGSTPGALARSVERWEAGRGNAGFGVRHACAHHVDVATELLSVYVTLRERFAAVRPDYLDLAADLGDGLSGAAWTYPDLFPHLRARAAVSGTGDPHTLLAMGGPVRRRERDSAAGVCDVTASGCIELSKVFATRTGYRRHVAVVSTHETSRVAAGRCATPPTETQLAVSTLVHEFGHLVDAEVGTRGVDALDAVYGELSAAVFGTRPKISQWRYHLANYPALAGAVPGPYAGRGVRRRATRAALAVPIGSVLGRYAASSRDECFAEAFCFAHCGAPPLRERLRPFIGTLAEVLSNPAV